jgi:CO/xanthine dehydrogenase FAD-binding subunit
VKLPAFHYHRASTADHAVELLAANPDETRVLAGGQSLLPIMALRLAQPGAVVDITRCEDLRTWVFRDGVLVVPAAVTAREIERSPEIAERHPLLTAVLGHVGHAEIRNRGTVCGSAAHADPAAEVPALLLGLDGAVQVLGPGGRRRVAARDFFLGHYTTALEPGELVAAVEIPTVAASSGWSIKELARRHGDFALVGALCVVTSDPVTRACTDASVTVFGVAAAPRRCVTTEEHLVGRVLDETVVADAARVAFHDIDVLGDIHGSSEFRTRAGTALVTRAIVEACARAQRAGAPEGAAP